MIFEQFYLNCLAHASYLVGDDTTHTAVVVDPQRDVQIYELTAAEHDLRIRHVFLTHFHADFLAGHLELRDRGATIHLGASAAAEYPFVSMKTGDSLELGDVRLEVIETPGHTAESISILVFDLARSATTPYAVLTGDTLFIGDVGRPDLRASLGWSATDLGGLLFDSLHTKLVPLPDRTLVYPAHGAGSLCGKAISKETVSTIGEQRRGNYALQPMSRDEFVRLVTADQPDAPDYFTYDAVLNARERPTLGSMLEHARKPLALSEVLRLQTAGDEIIDTRSPEQFATGHLRGAVNIGLGGQYATWAGTLLDRTRAIVVIADPGREEEAVMRLGRIGFDNVAGFLDQGMQSLDGRPDLIVATERVDAAAAAGHLASATPPLVLDVRTPREWDERHIAGSVNMPLNRLLSNLSELPRERHLLVTCAGGYRSSIALSLLQRAGFEGRLELSGGMAGWNAAEASSDAGSRG